MKLYKILPFILLLFLIVIVLLALAPKTLLKKFEPYRGETVFIKVEETLLVNPYSARDPEKNNVFLIKGSIFLGMDKFKQKFERPLNLSVCRLVPPGAEILLPSQETGAGDSGLIDVMVAGRNDFKAPWKIVFDRGVKQFQVQINDYEKFSKKEASPVDKNLEPNDKYNLRFDYTIECKEFPYHNFKIFDSQASPSAQDEYRGSPYISFRSEPYGLWANHESNAVLIAEIFGFDRGEASVLFSVPTRLADNTRIEVNDKLGKFSVKDFGPRIIAEKELNVQGERAELLLRINPQSGTDIELMNISTIIAEVPLPTWESVEGNFKIREVKVERKTSILYRDSAFFVVEVEKEE